MVYVKKSMLTAEPQRAQRKKCFFLAVERTARKKLPHFREFSKNKPAESPLQRPLWQIVFDLPSSQRQIKRKKISLRTLRLCGEISQSQ
jgi:hypothetical protein